MPDGGDLTITTRRDPEKKSVDLKVTDTGVGIPPENIDKIFDPFFTNKPEGTGLGLAIARQLLEKNQATIQALLERYHFRHQLEEELPNSEERSSS